MKILELFSGYGSQKLALDRLGFNTISQISEIDKYAIEAYNQLHGETINHGDITKIDETKLDKDFDLITYSSPCQDFSVAGKQRGGEQGSGTRSSLLWECERIIAATKPKYLLMENVKNLVGKRFKPCFDAWLKRLESLGYRSYWKVLNAKDYGIPQNRERVFVVSIRNDVAGDYVFPGPLAGKCPVLIDFLENNVDEKFFLNDEKVKEFFKKNPHILKIAGRETVILTKQGTQCERVTDSAVCLMARDYKGFGNQAMTAVIDDLYPDRPGRVTDYKCPHCITYSRPRIRRLTPREYWRLMGVLDNEFDRLHDISNTQLYKLAGNSIVVNVLMAIFTNLFK